MVHTVLIEGVLREHPLDLLKDCGQFQLAAVLQREAQYCGCRDFYLVVQGFPGRGLSFVDSVRKRPLAPVPVA